jgi:2-amino-4-hydroxy-6-hydroxymethyldihydropteridine diphosphokinase
MTKNIAVIGIGSNIDAESNIQKMLEILKKEKEVEIQQVSTFLQTKPVGNLNQPDYINGAVKIATSLEKECLNQLLKSIEDQLGRDRKLPKFSARTMDLDMVVWNGEIIDMDYYTRDFLKKSVQEVIPF